MTNLKKSSVNLDKVTSNHILKVKELKDKLDDELQELGSVNALYRSEIGRLFLTNLINGSYISPVFLHMAVEAAAQDFWEYTLFSPAHFRAVGISNREILKAIDLTNTYHEEVKELKSIHDEELTQFER